MKTVSIIALVLGIITFFFGLMGCMMITGGWWWQTVTSYPATETDIIAACFAFPGLLSFGYFMGYLLPIPATGLVLSVVTLFIEPNKRHRLLPLLFTLLGLYMFKYLLSRTQTVVSTSEQVIKDQAL